MDWDTLHASLQAACDDPGDEAIAERAVAAAEIVVSTAGEPPDELPGDAREWVETHGVPDEALVELACRSIHSRAPPGSSFGGSPAVETTISAAATACSAAASSPGSRCTARRSTTRA